jgi:adenine-specific DNA-methyltransferase
MVQLDEACNEKSDAYKQGYKTISQIGKERIRRVCAAMKNENAGCDLGVRVFKVADEQNSNIKEDRTDLDLLFGCLLEERLPLSLPYSSVLLEGCTIHNYNNGDLIACFDENIPDSVIRDIAKKKPLRAVFRDSSFADSPSKMNAGEIFKLLAPDTRVKII